MSRHGGVPDADTAASYTELHRHVDTERTVDFLAALCGSGPALELGVGAGRVALPLAARHVAVHGIDASDAMLEQLAVVDPHRTVLASNADFCDFSLPHRYDLVYCLYNAIFGLLTVRDQARCFSCVAAHLSSGGCFVVQCFVPHPDMDERVFAAREDRGGSLISAGTRDPVRQLIRTRQTYVRAGGSHSYNLAYRYSYPDELDRMAASAGLELDGRWADWAAGPFVASSTHHVSVYRRRHDDPGWHGSEP